MSTAVGIVGRLEAVDTCYDTHEGSLCTHKKELMKRDTRLLQKGNLHCYLCQYDSMYVLVCPNDNPVSSSAKVAIFKL